MKCVFITFILSMLPIIELRGAIPYGLSKGLSLKTSIGISVLGNILVIPLVLKIVSPIMDFFEGTRVFQKTIGDLKKKTLRKTKDKIKKYSSVGLMIFVAIPLPTTGVWTASLASKLLRVDPKKASFSISIGCLISALIVSLISYNVLEFLS